MVRTAVQVSATPRRCLRYGFVADYRPDRDVGEVVEHARRLHLTAVQCYDWAYRHADLLGGGERYDDPLGNAVSLATVRRLVEGLGAAGVATLGYAAVYGVGAAEWPRWGHLALQQADGTPYTLGDFLSLVDPAAPEWLDHFVDDLARAVASVGFDGFHLDQYGYPRRAVRHDGTRVDVAASFVSVIEAARAGLPTSRLVFNNVNDFPTWRTAPLAQDAVYIEAWPPHVTLGSLAAMVTRARTLAGDTPVVVAAYQHVYRETTAACADLAASFTMATLFSHGATHLLAGEDGRVLVEPYYVDNHVAERVDTGPARALVRLPRRTRRAADRPRAGGRDRCVGGPLQRRPRRHVRRRRRRRRAATRVCLAASRGPSRRERGARGAPRQPRRPGRHPVGRAATPGGCHRHRDVADPAGRSGAAARSRVADPDRAGRLVDVPVRSDGAFAVAELPAPHVWQVVLVEPSP